MALLLLAFLFLGWCRSSGAERARDERLAEWLPEREARIENDVDGILLEAPERLSLGEHRLDVETDPHSSGGRASIRLRLTVAGCPGGGRCRIAGLRRGDAVKLWCRINASPRWAEGRKAAYARVLIAQGIDAAGWVKSELLVLRREGSLRDLLTFADCSKAWFRHRLDDRFGSESAARAILGAMLLGDDGAVGSEAVRLLRDSGLLHLLAVSGLNVGLFLVLVLPALRRLTQSGALVFALASSLLGGFAFVSGSEPPVLRAALAACLALFGRSIGRGGDPLNTLVVVAATMAIVRPGLLLHVGFQMSFAATAALLALTRRFSQLIPLPRTVATSLALSFAAYLATAPLTAWHFGRVAPVAVVSNLLAAPLCAFLLGAGSAAVLFGDLPFLGTFAAHLALLSVQALEATARIMASWPSGSARVAPPSIVLLATMGACAIGALVGWRGCGLSRIALAMTFILLHCGRTPPQPDGTLSVAVLDVGQGQSLVVRGPGGGLVVIDGGGTSRGRFDAGDRIVGPYLAALGGRRIDAVVLSHDDEDHVGGIGSLLRDWDVGELWIGVGGLQRPRTAALVDEALSRGTSVRLVKAGDIWKRQGLELRVLHPGPEDRDLSDNDRSVALQVRGSGGRLLVTGDLEEQGEDRLLARDADTASEVLVFGHHGASHSTSTALLAAVRPRLGLISVGEDNRFGHPSPTVLERARVRGLRLERTDQGGTLRLRCVQGYWIVEAEFRRREGGPG